MEYKFKTKSGLLTDYALSCGYMEVFESTNRRVSLYKEHGVYHVKNTSNEFRYWNVFETLKDARVAFKAQKRSL